MRVHVNPILSVLTWWRLRQARSKNLPTRILAIEKLGRIADARVAEALTKLLDSEVKEVHQAAHDALQDMGPIAVDALVLNLRGSSAVEIRREVICLLGKIGDHKAVEPLRRMLRDPDETIRMAVLEVLGELGGPQTFESLMEALGDESSSVRGLAVDLLGKLGDRRSVSRICRALQDEYLHVRVSAIEALGLIGDEAAVGFLLPFFQGDHPAVRHRAAQALERIGWRPSDQTQTAAFVVALHRWDQVKALGEAAVEALAVALVDKDTKVAAISALGDIGGDRAVELLAGLLSGTNDGCRELAAFALGQIANAKAIDALLVALSDKEPLLRSTILRTLEDIRDPRIVPYLVDRLRDPDLYVRELAVSLLQKIGWRPQNDEERAWRAIAAGDWKDVAACGSAAVGPLLAVLAVPYTNTFFQTSSEIIGRRLALTTLGQLAEQDVQDSRIIPYLVDRLCDPQIELRDLAATALQKIGWRPQNDEQRAWQAIAAGDWKGVAACGSAAVGPLLAVLSAPCPDAFSPTLDEPYVRAKGMAALTLGQLAERTAVEPLLAALEHQDSRVREAAAWALMRIGDRKAGPGLMARIAEPADKLFVFPGDPVDRVRARAAYALGELEEVNAATALARRLPYEPAFNQGVFLSALDKLAKAGCTTPDEVRQRAVAQQTLYRWQLSAQAATSSLAHEADSFAAEQIAEAGLELSESASDLALLFLGLD